MQRSEKWRELGLEMINAVGAGPGGKHGWKLPAIREVQS